MDGLGHLEEMKGSLPLQERQSPKQRVTVLGTANGRTTPGKADTGLSQEERLLPSRNAPLFPPPPRIQGPPLVVGDRAMAPCAPPPLRLPGQRAPAVAAAGAVSTLFPGGLRLRPPRCHPPRPRLCAVVAAVFQAAETLEGPASGAGPLITVS